MSTNANPESQRSDAAGLNAGLKTDGLPPATIDFDSLQQYTATKLTIANQLRTLLELQKKRGGGARVQQCEQLMAKLAEDRFSIAVLGQFKRGKSSLLNAVIGRDLLPTGVLPLTSVITAVRFGARPRLVIYRQNHQFPVLDSISALAGYVTESANPGNRKGIEMVAIELPLPYLRRGLEFVDTPGIGSAIKANTETTYSFLPQCDAVLFVTSVDSPLSEAEIDLLRSIRRFVRKTFFILNKVDLLSNEDDCRQVREFVSSRLRGEMNVSEISLIPVSARRALEASTRNLTSDFVHSGLFHLEEKLAQFLATERQSLFLGAIIDKASQLTTHELKETELIEKAVQVSATELQHRLKELKVEMEWRAVERSAILENIRERSARYLLGSVAEDLAACLGDAGDIALRRLDRFLSRVPLLPATTFIARYAKGVDRLFWTRLSRWNSTNNQRLVTDLNAAAKDDIEKLYSHFAELSTLALKAFGLAASEGGHIEDSDALLLDPGFKRELGWNMRWAPKLPFIFRFFPVALTRPLLRKWLHAELYKLVGEHELAMIKPLRRTVDEYLERLSQRVSAVAGKLERRADGMLSEKWRKQSGDASGPFDGETLVAYRRGLESLAANFSALRKHVQTDLKCIDDVPLNFVEAISAPASKSRPGPSTRQSSPKSYGSRGCPVCDHLVNVATDFFASFQYSLYSDEEQQQSFAEGGGFCPFHLWQLESISSPIGFSVGVAKLVRNVARLVERPTSPANLKETLHQLRSLGDRCPACSMLRQAEHASIGRLLSSLAENEARRSYALSPGVCLRHLEMAINSSPDEKTSALLLQTASTGFQRMAEDMEAFALKREASRRYMINEDEQDAYRRAVIHLAGAKQNCMPLTFDDEI